MNLEFLASNIIWLVYGIYCFGLLPQIFLNYKLKNATGMADGMLFGYFAGYTTQLFYVFALNLPLAYKVMVPMSCMVVIIMMIQRFYYNRTSFTQILSFGMIMVFLITYTPYFLMSDMPGGAAFGWASALIWGVYQIPQILKLYRQKSFKGFSFVFISLMAVALSLEFTSALILDLPLQTVISNIRGLVIYCIFFIQFLRYRL